MIPSPIGLPQSILSSDRPCRFSLSSCNRSFSRMTSLHQGSGSALPFAVFPVIVQRPQGVLLPIVAPWARGCSFFSFMIMQVSRPEKPDVETEIKIIISIRCTVLVCYFDWRGPQITMEMQKVRKNIFSAILMIGTIAFSLAAEALCLPHLLGRCHRGDLRPDVQGHQPQAQAPEPEHGDHALRGSFCHHFAACAHCQHPSGTGHRYVFRAERHGGYSAESPGNHQSPERESLSSKARPG